MIEFYNAKSLIKIGNHDEKHQFSSYLFNLRKKMYYIY